VKLHTDLNALHFDWRCLPRCLAFGFWQRQRREYRREAVNVIGVVIKQVPVKVAIGNDTFAKAFSLAVQRLRISLARPDELGHRHLGRIMLDNAGPRTVLAIPDDGASSLSEAAM
jgi:hypothetical protein